MLETVHTIFMAKNLAIAIVTYFNLVESVDKKIDKLISKEYTSAVQMLEQVRYISNPTIYANMLVNTIGHFNQAVALEKRERLLLSYLGLMICYFYLGETNALLNVQAAVAEQKFDVTFWEKYGGDIEKAGSVIFGVIATIAGGGSAGVGGAMGSKTGDSLREVHNEELKRRQENFENLKNAIIALQWTL